MDNQLSLFNTAPAAGATGPERHAAPLARQSIAGRPKWTAYRGPHRACDEGVRFTHNGGGDRPPRPGPVSAHPRSREDRHVHAVRDRLATGRRHGRPAEARP